ncbi:MAG: hypothetical protein ACXACG_14985 [Candidatus Thorarchaeota archaeon]|jgi:hydroxymethylglutaryl-CoA reductase (NADPH)
MDIPVFLLRKLYVKGSLANVDGGFQFKIKNSLAPGTATAVEPIKVNDSEYGLDTTTIMSDDGEISATDISENNAFQFKVGVEITMFVKSDPLPEGEHKIDISLTTKETGKLAFDVKDSI